MNAQTRSQQSEAYRQSDGYQTLKHRLHRFLILQIEEQNLDIGSWSTERIDRFIGEQLRRFVSDERVPVNQTEAELLVGDVRDELVGYGPIQGLVDDDSVDDIVIWDEVATVHQGPDDFWPQRRVLRRITAGLVVPERLGDPAMAAS